MRNGFLGEKSQMLPFFFSSMYVCVCAPTFLGNVEGQNVRMWIHMSYQWCSDGVRARDFCPAVEKNVLPTAPLRR